MISFRGIFTTLSPRRPYIPVSRFIVDPFHLIIQFIQYGHIKVIILTDVNVTRKVNTINSSNLNEISSYENISLIMLAVARH